MREQVDTAEQAVARMAARQHGVVTFAQLRAVGLDKSAVSRRTAAGRLHRVFRGVYAVGHPGLSREGRWTAAVLACGDGAVVSHRSAAVLWGLLSPATEPVHVSVPRTGGRATRSGIRVHRSRALDASMTTRRHAIPVTRPERTILDLRTAVTEKERRRATRQANILGLPLGPATESDETRSDLERKFLVLCRRHGIARPEVNVKIHGIEVDFLWRNRALVVETDGYRYHRGRVAFEGDRDRDLELKTLGYEVLRLSYRQVCDMPTEIADALRALLQAPPDSPTARPGCPR